MQIIIFNISNSGQTDVRTDMPKLSATTNPKQLQYKHIHNIASNIRYIFRQINFFTQKFYHASINIDQIDLSAPFMIPYIFYFRGTTLFHEILTRKTSKCLSKTPNIEYYIDLLFQWACSFVGYNPLIAKHPKCNIINGLLSLFFTLCSLRFRQMDGVFRCGLDSLLWYDI